MSEIQNKDLEDIRHFKGTLVQFKDFFDNKAKETLGKDTDTNAFGTPTYQGFNDVHPTRGEGKVEESKINSLIKFLKIYNGGKYEPVALAQSIYKNYKDLTGNEYTNYSDMGDEDFIADIVGYHKIDTDTWEEDFLKANNLKESNSTNTKVDPIPMFENFQHNK